MISIHLISECLKPDDARLSYTLVALKENLPVGSCGFQVEDRGTGLLTNLMVLPEYQNQGIGSLLMQATIELAHKEKLHNLWLTVTRNNHKARRLYQRFHFNIFFADEETYWMGIYLPENDPYSKSDA